jgi:RIO kinase 1
MWEKKISRLDLKIDEMRKKIKGVEDYKILDEVFDKSTLLSLYYLANKGVIDLLYGTIKTGKESNVFLGKKDEKELAVKIHRVGTSDYKAMLKYINGDQRFRGIKRRRRSVVYTWVKKEFKNLNRARECKVRVPRPIAYRNNVLVMEFIGRGGRAYPMLKDVRPKRQGRVYKEILGFMKKLYCKGNLVHADMSEYNILMKGNKPVLIDLSAAVVRDHPLAEEFLKRDVANIARYFDQDEEEALRFVKDCG